MSKDTLPFVRKALRKKTRPKRLRVLTWDPALSTDVFESFRLHLGEGDNNKEDKYEQIRSAARTWAKLNSKYRNRDFLEVRTYSSSPTMQALIVKDHWAIIELLPFHRTTSNRPAILLSADRDGDESLLKYFTSSFEELWLSGNTLD
jgi:hypothetical protein